MLPKRRRFSLRDFPEKAEKFFSGKILAAKRAPNRLNRNRFAAAIGAAKVKKAAVRNLLKRRLLARADNLPGSDWDILFIVLSRPASRRELDEEFDKIKEALK
jgi:ribonuclease P protein component